jgi:hypothetical protein
LVGPFTWLAPTSGYGNGHRCLLAAIKTKDGDAPANPYDAPGSYQVAQRNVQLSDCKFPLPNTTTSDGKVQLTLAVNADGATPGLSGATDIGMTFEDPTSDWYLAWQSYAGSDFSVTHDTGSGTTYVRLGTRRVILKPAPLAAGHSVAATGNIVLAAESPATTLSLEAILQDAAGSPLARNGGSCTVNPD